MPIAVACESEIDVTDAQAKCLDGQLTRRLRRPRLIEWGGREILLQIAGREQLDGFYEDVRRLVSHCRDRFDTCRVSSDHSNANMLAPQRGQ